MDTNKQYNGMGLAMRELEYDVFTMLELDEVSHHPKLLESLTQLEIRVQTLATYLQSVKPTMIERSSVAYLLHELETNLHCFNVKSLCNLDDLALVYSRNDVQLQIQFILEQMDLMI